jgi:hypothetical protein
MRARQEHPSLTARALRPRVLALLLSVLIGEGLCVPRAHAAQQPASDSAVSTSTRADSCGARQTGNDSASRNLTVAACGTPQRDVFDVVRHILGRPPHPPPSDSERAKPGLSKAILPIIGANPSYGTYFGASLTVGGWLGDPATTGVSSAALSGFQSTNGFSSITFRSTFDKGANRLLSKGDWRYLHGDQSTYGLGPATNGNESFPMEFTLYRFHETIYRRTNFRSLYIGLGYFFDRWTNIRDRRAEDGESTPYVQYNGGTAPSQTTSSGVSFEVLHDSRDNAINATRGLYWNAAMRVYTDWLGSDDDWQSLWNEVRLYPALGRSGRGRLAIWSYFWFTFGHAPYLDLPANSWDPSGRASRGYVQGRIRGQNQIYTEFEYRYGLTRDGLLGAVAFLNLMATTAPGSGEFGKMDPGFGVGLRLKFDKRTSTNLAVDYAQDRYGNGHVFFGMQEVF